MARGNLGLLLLLGALFGSAFLFIRVAAPVLGPVLLIELRVVAAAALLYAWAHVRGQGVSFGRPLKSWLLLGALNAALPFTLIAWAELHLTSSFAALLIATLPLFTALVSALWLKERLGARKLIGLLLGLVGVVVLSGGSPLELSPTGVLAMVAVLAASLSYALGSVYTKTHFHGVPRLSLTVGNFAAAGVVLLPLAAVAPPAVMPERTVLFALTGLVVAATVIPYLLFFRLLERAVATTATSVAYLIPAFGALWGALFLAEPLNAIMLFGFGIILLSVTLVTGVNLGPSINLAVARRKGAR